MLVSCGAGYGEQLARALEQPPAERFKALLLAADTRRDEEWLAGEAGQGALLLKLPLRVEQLRVERLRLLIHVSELVLERLRIHARLAGVAGKCGRVAHPRSHVYSVTQASSAVSSEKLSPDASTNI